MSSAAEAARAHAQAADKGKMPPHAWTPPARPGGGAPRGPGDDRLLVQDLLDQPVALPMGRQASHDNVHRPGPQGAH